MNKEYLEQLKNLNECLNFFKKIGKNNLIKFTIKNEI